MSISINLPGEVHNMVPVLSQGATATQSSAPLQDCPSVKKIEIKRPGFRFSEGRVSFFLTFQFAHAVFAGREWDAVGRCCHGTCPEC